MITAQFHYFTTTGEPARRSASWDSVTFCHEAKLSEEQAREVARDHASVLATPRCGTYVIQWGDGSSETHAASCPGKGCACSFAPINRKETAK